MIRVTVFWLMVKLNLHEEKCQTERSAVWESNCGPLGVREDTVLKYVAFSFEMKKKPLKL